MRSAWFRAQRKKTGRSLLLEGLLRREMLHLTWRIRLCGAQKGSLKETELYPDSPYGFMILVTVFRSGALRSSLWMKLSWKVLPGMCAIHWLWCMSVLWSCPNLPDFSAFQETLCSSRFSCWVTSRWDAGEVAAVYMQGGSWCCLCMGVTYKTDLDLLILFSVTYNTDESWKEIFSYENQRKCWYRNRLYVSFPNSVFFV